MALTSHAAAGVYIQEIDLSLRLANATVSVGAVVGPSKKGPPNVRVLVTDTAQFIQLYGEPDPTFSYLHYAAVEFLKEGDRLYITRAAPTIEDEMDDGRLAPRYGGVVIGLQDNLSIKTDTYPTTGLHDPDTELSFVFDAGDKANGDLFMLRAIDPGVWNNDLKVVVRDNTAFDDNTFYVDVYLGDSTVPVEQYLCALERKRDGYGNQLYLEDVINNKSTYLRARINDAHPRLIDSAELPAIN